MNDTDIDFLYVLYSYGIDDEYFYGVYTDKNKAVEDGVEIWQKDYESMKEILDDESAKNATEAYFVYKMQPNLLGAMKEIVWSSRSVFVF